MKVALASVVQLVGVSSSGEKLQFGVPGRAYTGVPGLRVLFLGWACVVSGPGASGRQTIHASLLH